MRQLRSLSLTYYWAFFTFVRGLSCLNYDEAHLLRNHPPGRHSQPVTTTHSSLQIALLSPQTLQQSYRYSLTLAAFGKDSCVGLTWMSMQLSNLPCRTPSRTGRGHQGTTLDEWQGGFLIVITIFYSTFCL
ncbi:hypothetical protein BDV09DRAFT_157566 [Aspergillus tetrazonus]